MKLFFSTLMISLGFSGSVLAAEFPPAAKINVNIEGATYGCNLTNDPSAKGIFFGEAEGLARYIGRGALTWDCQGFTLQAYRTAKARCVAAGFSKCGGPLSGGWIEVADGGGAASMEVVKYSHNVYTAFCQIRVSVKGSN